MEMDWQSWLPAAGIGGLALLFVLTGWLLALSLQLRRLTRLLRRLIPEAPDQPLDRLLERVLAKQEENRTHIAAIEQQAERLQLLLQGCLQRVGLVRFDAFNDTAGQQSFAVALLDNQGNGVVITSLFGRTESRCYAKPITHGSSTHRLSDEEKAAIRQALGQPVGQREGR